MKPSVAEMELVAIIEMAETNLNALRKGSMKSTSSFRKEVKQAYNALIAGFDEDELRDTVRRMFHDGDSGS